MKLNNREGQRVDASNPFRRGGKIIPGNIRREGSGWERRGGGKKVDRTRYGKREERSS